MLPGFLFSHASSRAARSLAFAQWRSTWDRVILGPLQNQQLLSARLRILFKNTAERQWPVLICAAALAMECPCMISLAVVAGSLRCRGSWGPCARFL